MNEFDPHLQNIVQAELYSGETLLWVGKPKFLRILRRHILRLIVPVLILLVFLVFFHPFFSMVTVTFGDLVASIPTLFLWLFIAVFIFMLGQPLSMIYKETASVYAITNYRALIITPIANGRSIRSFGERDIQNIERREYKHGTGDLIFNREEGIRRYRTSGGYYLTGSYTVEIGFFGILHVRTVELLMLETLKMMKGIEQSEPTHKAIL